MNTIFTNLIALLGLLPWIALSDDGSSSPAGLRWAIGDDTGWNAKYERFGVSGTVEDQSVITFLEIVDSEFKNKSVLEVFVSSTGSITARRLTADGNYRCIYTGQLEQDSSLDEYFGHKTEAQHVKGTYTCAADQSTGEWKGTVFW